MKGKENCGDLEEVFMIQNAIFDALEYRCKKEEISHHKSYKRILHEMMMDQPFQIDSFRL